MKKSCACGFIIEEPRGWLLCHPTNSGNRWDFPKGGSEVGEDHLVAAKRELLEETGLVLTSNQDIIDLGQHPYQDNRDLHLYYVKVDKIDTKVMHCTSMVLNPKGKNFPEMDAFVVFPKDLVLSKVGNRLKTWITKFIPKEIFSEAS
jgi:predicted NUDIX family NTP pyrophosphohydrolase